MCWSIPVTIYKAFGWWAKASMYKLYYNNAFSLPTCVVSYGDDRPGREGLHCGRAKFLYRKQAVKVCRPNEVAVTELCSLTACRRVIREV